MSQYKKYDILFNMLQDQEDNDADTIDNELEQINETTSYSTDCIIENFDDFVDYCIIYEGIDCNEEKENIELVIRVFHDHDYCKPSKYIENTQEINVLHSAETGNFKIVKTENNILHRSYIEMFDIIECDNDYCDKNSTSSTKKEEDDILEEIHFEEKKFACRICGQLFSQLLLLKKHTKIHLGKYLNCIKCNMAFNRKDSLKLHIQNIHNIIFSKKTKIEYWKYNPNYIHKNIDSEIGS